MVSIEVFIDAKGVLDKFHGLMNRIPIEKRGIMRDIAYAYRDSLIESAGKSFSFPRPQLVKSIIAKKHGDGWAVFMARYGRMVDTGRGPGKMPPDTPQMRKWAGAAGIDLFWLRRSIGRYGTKPRPFISSAMIRARTDKLPKILSRHAKNLVKK